MGDTTKGTWHRPRNKDQWDAEYDRIFGPKANGECHNCGEPIPKGARWCDGDCQYLWENAPGKAGKMS